MQATDSYEDRVKMVGMHSDVLKRINSAITEKRSIEACWFCYACLEGRLKRTLEKLSQNCLKGCCREKGRLVSFSARLNCIDRLRSYSYAGAEYFDQKLLDDIRKWCLDRNKLVHALVTLNNYEGMDEKFLELAVRGKPLVEQLYKQTTKFRMYYYEIESLPEFPTKAEKKCRLKVKEQNKQDSSQP